MNLKISFSWIGLVVFALPMLINIAYAIFPPSGKVEQTAAVTRWIEMVEQVSRIAHLLAITLFVSREPIRLRSAWLCAAALFLLLYYIVWIRYFAGGRDITLLNRRFSSCRCRWRCSLCCTFYAPLYGFAIFRPRLLC